MRDECRCVELEAYSHLIILYYFSLDFRHLYYVYLVSQQVLPLAFTH